MLDLLRLLLAFFGGLAGGMCAVLALRLLRHAIEVGGLLRRESQLVGLLWVILGIRSVVQSLAHLELLGESTPNLTLLIGNLVLLPATCAVAYALVRSGRYVGGRRG